MRSRRTRLGLLVALLLAAAAPTLPAAARTLEVGPGKPFARPSQAARAAQAGDRIVIAPGRYQDCAVLAAPDLTVEAATGDVVEISGPVCAGKGLFITTAPRITITGITFQGATGPSGNGAGIRAEGGDLTIRRSRFLDNQNGILAPSGPTARLVVEDSVFIGNGALEPGLECAHGIYVGPLALLSIRRSRFEATRICHHVKSRALSTEITDSHIIDGAETRSSYLVDVPNGGDLLLARSVLRKGPGAGNTTIAVAIGAEGVRHPTNSLRIDSVDFANLQSVPTAFVRNWSQVPVIVTNTQISGPGPVTPIQGPGSVR
jgi:hypothetical protein